MNMFIKSKNTNDEVSLNCPVGDDPGTSIEIIDKLKDILLQFYIAYGIKIE